MDAYDLAIKYFSRHPERIYKVWNRPSSSKYGFLFAYMRKKHPLGFPEAENDDIDNENRIGCISLIFNDGYKAETKKLTEICRKAKLPYGINFDSLDPKEAIQYLPEFARIQRIADKLLKRTSPTL